MNYQTLLTLLKNNISIPNYRCVVLVQSKFDMERLLQDLGDLNLVKFRSFESKLKHSLNHGVIRFVFPSTPVETVRGIVIYQAFSLVSGESRLKSEIQSRATMWCGNIVEVR